MNLRLKHLDLLTRSVQERIEFSQFSYFYGEIGAGKSTIARLIDYCFGGKLIMTPALQSEFVSAILTLEISGAEVTLSRERESEQIVASWETPDGVEYVKLPTRKPAGIVISGTKVEVLSDLIFHLNDVQAPRVRRSAIREESELERLSIRDLLWYCYLDQDTIDSSFFHLDVDADHFRRLKSRNVLRYLLGIHQERVAELEVELEELRRERTGKENLAKALKMSLQEAGISTVMEIANRLGELSQLIQRLQNQITSIREEGRQLVDHAVDSLRNDGQQLASELEAIELAVEDVSASVAIDRRHRNEILALSTKVQRIGGARAVLNGVEFVRCPRCAQDLPPRSQTACSVCGQDEPTLQTNDEDTARTKADIESRTIELEEVIERQLQQLQVLHRRNAELRDKKAAVDKRLDEASQQYDSAYLSVALEYERQLAAADQEQRFLSRLQALPQKMQELAEQAVVLGIQEAAIREELKELRAESEKDLGNIDKLKSLFLDCLLRSNLPGFSADDDVRLSPPSFLPEVLNPISGDIAITSFATLGSGGKKTLFKCCFALALHRLAMQLGAPLPSLLIIDSPMKNISERENRRHFEGFHSLLYELAEGELAATQFILIDKEFCPPPEHSSVQVRSRHMRVDSENEPPLIPYYRD
ncbi:Rad50/SbcC-type AAA domain containing protein [Fimbriimonadaceae bacterium]